MNSDYFIRTTPSLTSASSPECSGSVIASCNAEVAPGQPLQGEDINMGYVSQSTPPVSTTDSLQLPPAQQPLFNMTNTETTVVERIADARANLERLENVRENFRRLRLQVTEDALNKESICTTPEELNKIHAHEMKCLVCIQSELDTTDKRIAHIAATIQHLKVPHLATTVTETFDLMPSTWNSVGTQVSIANGSSFEDNIPRFGPQKARNGLPYKTIGSPLAFLDKFHSYCSNNMDVNFESNCHRMLIMAILEDGPRIQLFQKLNQIPAGDMSWEKCEEHFIEIVPTRAQREKDIKRVIRGGRRKGELYLHYARRLMHFIRIYKIDVFDKEYMEAIFYTVPSDILSQIETRLMVLNPNNPLLDSLTTFCKMLEKFHGPNDELDTVSGTNVSEENTGHSRKRNHSSHIHNRNPYGEHSDVQETNWKATRYNCKKCGDNNTHSTEECIICDYCQKRGHFTAACRILKRA